MLTKACHLKDIGASQSLKVVVVDMMTAEAVEVAQVAVFAEVTEGMWAVEQKMTKATEATEISQMVPEANEISRMVPEATEILVLAAVTSMWGIVVKLTEDSAQILAITSKAE